MKTGVEGSQKKYLIRWAPKCYRFKEEAFGNHAPQAPGIYVLVTHPGEPQASTLYVGLTLDTSIQEKLWQHWQGDHPGITAEIQRVPPVLYFCFVWQSDAQSDQDLCDIAWFLVEQDKPLLNIQGVIKHSGRYSDIEVKEE